MKRLILGILFVAMAEIGIRAQQVFVDLKYDRSTVTTTTVDRTQSNLEALFNEINSACDAGRDVNLGNLQMSAFAKKAVEQLWKNVHFKTKSSRIVDRLWVFKRSRQMLVSHMPIVLVDDSPLDGDEQDAIVEFDLNGKITDFRFSVDPQAYESMDNKSDVAELEEQLVIWTWVQRFFTAYNQKDIDFLNQIFSDDALIITGNVVNVRTAEAGMTQKVQYNKQNKTQYLRNLMRCFARNRWIKVTFEPIDKNPGSGNASKFITHRVGRDGRNYYGVRIKQYWTSANGYHDEGYVFLLWEFPQGQDPIIHVRTWQPSKLNGKEISVNEIFSDVDFVK